MPELAEPIIQTDAFEPTLYDVMDQLAAVHGCIDSTDNRLDNLREYMDEKFALVGQEFQSLDQKFGDLSQQIGTLWHKVSGMGQGIESLKDTTKDIQVLLKEVVRAQNLQMKKD